MSWTKILDRIDTLLYSICSKRAIWVITLFTYIKSDRVQISSSSAPLDDNLYLKNCSNSRFVAHEMGHSSKEGSYGTFADEVLSFTQKILSFYTVIQE